MKLATAYTLTPFLFLGCAATHSDTSSRGHTLDGRTCTIHVTADSAAHAAGGFDFDDQLIFVDGKLRSTACEGIGFQATPYTAGGESRMEFETSQHSSQAGDTHWRGTIDGDHVEGTLLSTRPDGQTWHSTFNGTCARSTR
jgi:hypothetical protein